MVGEKASGRGRSVGDRDVGDEKIRRSMDKKCVPSDDCACAPPPPGLRGRKEIEITKRRQ